MVTNIQTPHFLKGIQIHMSYALFHFVQKYLVQEMQDVSGKRIKRCPMVCRCTPEVGGKSIGIPAYLGRFIATLLIIATVGGLGRPGPAWAGGDSTHRLVEKRRSLVFNLDQCFSNGPIYSGDWLGLQRMISSLKAFQSRYKVYALVSGMLPPEKLDHALDMFARNGIPFILDVWGSDVETIYRPWMRHVKPYDVAHGRALSIAQLRKYKAKYPKAFAGICIFEVFGQNYVDGKYMPAHRGDPTWPYRKRMPTDGFFHKRYLRQYVRFVHENGMFAIFCDWCWLGLVPYRGPILRRLRENEHDLLRVIDEYPDTVIVMFDNNAPIKRTGWMSSFSRFRKAKIRGLALSDQAWIAPNPMTASPRRLGLWARSAFAGGCILVETEPYWYWWRLPAGSLIRVPDYTRNPAWTDRGLPRNTLRIFAGMLGINLPK